MVATLVAMIVLSPALTLLSPIVLPAIWLSRKVAMIRRAVTDERQQALAQLHPSRHPCLVLACRKPWARLIGRQRFEDRSEA